jgi:uncharacterized membrane protein YhaH (DUF805 family)
LVDTFVLVPLVKPVALESTSRAVSAPGVPLKLATGTNRNEVLAAKYKAAVFVKPVMAISVHRVVPLACHCHLPCAAVAALAVMTTPAKVLALLPLVTASAVSLKRLENKAEIKAPAGLVVSSATAANVAEPEATGASFTAVMLMVLVAVAVLLAFCPSLTVTVRVRLPLTWAAPW